MQCSRLDKKQELYDGFFSFPGDFGTVQRLYSFYFFGIDVLPSLKYLCMHGPSLKKSDKFSELFWMSCVLMLDSFLFSIGNILYQLSSYCFSYCGSSNLKTLKSLKKQNIFIHKNKRLTWQHTNLTDWRRIDTGVGDQSLCHGADEGRRMVAQKENKSTNK